MAPRFYSKEWCEAVKQKANSAEDYLKKQVKMTAKMVFIVTDCPDGNDVKLMWIHDKGHVDYIWEAKPAPADFRRETEPWDESIGLSRTQGAYLTYQKIQKREMSLMQSMASKLYVTDGDMIKAMQFMPNMVAFADLQGAVECEY
ncbi:hypothetical protein ACFLT3_00465 [Chloroflexota bacterium]